MKKGAILFFLCFIFFAIPAMAEVQFLGGFKTDTCVTLKQTCGNCTFVNYSVSGPPQKQIILANQTMTLISPTVWAAQFCNTSQNGEYIYDTYGNLNGANQPGPVSFIVNPIGKVLTSAQATLYSLMFIVSFIFFLLLFSFGLYAPSKNESDEMTGYILAVSNMKYLKMFFLALSYLILMVQMYFGYIISYGYLEIDFLGNLFYYVFYTMVVLLIPLFVLAVYLLISNLVRDHKIGEALSRGLRVR